MPLGSSEHHLPIPSRLHRYISNIRDHRRGLFDPLIHFLRFLRFLRNDLRVETSDWWGRWLNRPQTPMHKARVAVGSPPSAPLNGITELFDKPLLLWGEKPLCGWESCKSSPRAREPSALQPHHAQLRKKRIKSNKEPVWRCSTGASGLPRRRS